MDDDLADFLGHDIRVHRQYYRLTQRNITACQNKSSSYGHGTRTDI